MQFSAKFICSFIDFYKFYGVFGYSIIKDLKGTQGFFL